MNNKWADYLEQEQKQELVKSLSAEGYQVIEPQPDAEFDLLARKGNDVIAYEIKLANRLGSFAKQIAAMRRIATERGYADFRLVVLRPPRDIDVEVADIELKLHAYLNTDVPSELFELAQVTRIREVTDVEYSAVRINETGIFLTGDAVASVELEYEGGDERDGLTTHMTFPFKFEVVMNRELDILEATSVFDLRSWYE